MRVDSVEELLTEIAEESRAFKVDPGLIPVARDGKCYELAMLFTHHLDADARKEVGEAFPIPQLCRAPRTSRASSRSTIR